jgi:hypothetical protein
VAAPVDSIPGSTQSPARSLAPGILPTYASAGPFASL